ETGRAAHFCGPGFLAVGDAAYTTDPARGQGILRALSSACDAADAADAFLAGDTTGLAGYSARLEASFRADLAGLPAQYRMESRWCEAPFWRRRHAAPAELPTGRRRL